MSDSGRGHPVTPRRLIAALLMLGLIAVAVAGMQPGIQIRWVTESELDVTGYNLYRSPEPDGAFRQINPNLLPPAADPFLGAEHFYEDTDVRLGRTYYYELETIDRSGNRTRSQPIGLRPSLRWRLLGSP